MRVCASLGVWWGRSFLRRVTWSSTPHPHESPSAFPPLRGVAPSSLTSVADRVEEDISRVSFSILDVLETSRLAPPPPDGIMASWRPTPRQSWHPFTTPWLRTADPQPVAPDAPDIERVLLLCDSQQDSGLSPVRGAPSHTSWPPAISLRPSPDIVRSKSVRPDVLNNWCNIDASPPVRRRI